MSAQIKLVPSVNWLILISLPPIETPFTVSLWRILLDIKARQLTQSRMGRAAFLPHPPRRLYPLRGVAIVKHCAFNIL